MHETLEETRPNLSEALIAVEAAEFREASAQKRVPAPDPLAAAEEAARLRNVRLPLWNAFLTARFAAGGDWTLDADSLLTMDVLKREVERAAASRSKS